MAPHSRPTRSLEAVLRRDRLVVASALCVLIGLGWTWLLAGAGMEAGMADMPDMVMAAPAWTPRYALLMFVMWWVMMVAMMLPSAAPTILLAAAISRARQGDSPYGNAGFFVAGYLLAWALFSAAAVLAQGALGATELLTGAMAAASPRIAGAVLIGAGLWQFAPLKRMCLRHCRSPVMFLTAHHRAGNLGSLRMGAEHGAYCVGCCGFLMALLFVGGVMNLAWVLALSAYVLVEKLFPWGPRIGAVVGGALGLWGLVLMLGLTGA